MNVGGRLFLNKPVFYTLIFYQYIFPIMFFVEFPPPIFYNASKNIPENIFFWMIWIPPVLFLL